MPDPMIDKVTEALILTSLKLTMETPGEQEEVQKLLVVVNSAISDVPVHRVVSVLYLMLRALRLGAEQAMERGSDGATPN